MKKITKRILVTSAVMAGAGVVLMGAGIALGGWPGVVFTKGGIRSPYDKRTPYRQEKKEIDPFSELSLYVGSEADVSVAASEDGKYYIEYTFDGNYSEPKYELKNGKLSFTQQDHGGYMTGIFGLSIGNVAGEDSYIKVYVPKGTVLDSADIYNDYGDVSWSTVNGKEVSIEADSGDVKLEQSETTSMELILNDGDASADTLKTGTFLLQSDYGDSTLADVSGKDLTVQAECGEVDMERVSFENMAVEALDGDVLTREVSSSSADLTLEYGDLRWDAKKLENLTCQTECGDVDLVLPEVMEQYQFDLQLEYGDLSLPENAPHDLYREEDGEVSYRILASEKNAGKKISVMSEDGDVKVRYR